MSVLLALTISVCVAAGVWLVLSRDVFRLVIGLAVLGSAANLVVFLGGRPSGLTPPLILQGATTLGAQAANPLPQALVLTAIVIGFALLCFGLVLAARLSRQHGQVDIAHYQASEPRPVEGQSRDKPPILE
jgi:multicomponent Na+:H+ antiporter subunit C